MGGTVAIATIGLALHTIAAVVWVGGMFFALIALRPATAPLEPGPRLELWSRVLGRFFQWVIAAIVLLLLSGYGMIFGVYSGFRGVGLHVHIMQGIGIVMMLAFFHLYFAPWRRFRDVIVPNALPGILAGSLMVVTLSLGEFNLTWMLHTPLTKTLPIGLADSYASMRLEVASAYTLIFFVMIIPLLVAMQLFAEKEQRR